MNSTHHRSKVAPFARWAGFAVILLLLISPVQLLAAPAQQVDPTLVGTWQSVPSTTGETVTVSLFEDGTLQGTSTYADNDNVILYGGTWESTEEDAFTLHILSVNGDESGSIDFPGLVTRRGLRLPDAPDWGSNGMTLRLISDEPTDFAAGATEEVVAEATEEPIEEATAEATAEPVDDPVAEATPVATEEAAEASGYAGVYTSGPLVDEVAGATRVINIVLYDEGSMETYSSYEDANTTNASLELGFWEDAGDGTLTITFESIDGENYDPAVPLTFEILDDGAQLLAAAVTAYSEGGLLVTRTDDELPSAVEETENEGEEVAGEPVVSVADGFTVAGLYTTGPVDVGGGSVAGIFVYLGEDGFAQSAVVVMNGSTTPVARVGEWVANDDGSVSVSLASEMIFDDSESATLSDLSAPEVLDFEVVGNTLVNPEITLYPAGDVQVIGDSASTLEESTTEATTAGTPVATEEPVEEATPAATPAPTQETSSNTGDSVTFLSPIDTVIAGTNASLVLFEDGTASLAIVSDELDSTVVEIGTWEADEQGGVLTLTMTGDGFGVTFDEPSVLIFTISDDETTLTPDEYDVDHYGPDLTLEILED